MDEIRENYTFHRIVRTDDLDKKGAVVRTTIERLANLRLRREGSGEAGFIGGILKVVQVSNPRRMMLHDRETLAFDFTGDPRLTAHGMGQNTEKKTAGTIWIDEVDHQVARFEICMADNFRVGGGILASVQKGTRIEVEQSPIAEGLWMPTLNQEHVDVRMVVAHERRNLLVTDSDFGRFDVNALQKIGPPSR